MKVFKFGGGILSNALNIRKVTDLIKSFDDKLIIVVSALGKTTNMLEEVFFKFHKNSNYAAELQKIYVFHKNLILDLFNEKKILEEFDNLFSENQRIK